MVVYGAVVEVRCSIVVFEFTGWATLTAVLLELTFRDWNLD